MNDLDSVSPEHNMQLASSSTHRLAVVRMIAGRCVYDSQRSTGLCLHPPTFDYSGQF